MDRLLYVFVILVLVSCDNLTEVKKEKTTFYFTDNISATRREAIANGVMAEIQQLKLESLGIETVKIDSVPFSIIMYVPYKHEVTKDTEESFKYLSNLVSRFDLGQTPIHVILTDDKFNPTKGLAYDKDAVIYEGEIMKRGLAEVKLSENARTFSADILEQVLHNRMPELYKDSVRIFVDVVNDTVKVDFKVDPNQSNLDTLRKQFLNTDRLFFDLLFARRTVLFHVRHRQTKAVIIVFGLRGE
jgi:hypothetical protein